MANYRLLTMRPQYLISKHKVTIFNPATVQNVDHSWFDIDAPKPEPQYRTLAEHGRGKVWLMQYGDQQWVLRHYCRGGFIGRLFLDAYLWLGARRTRAWREWHLTAQLFDQGMPVPEPVAAQTRRYGFLYRADLITRYIPDTDTLHHYLLERPIETGMWQQIGRMIRRFHDAGVYHNDLNARNILINSQNELFMIDFDQAAIRRHGRWKQQNLKRLLRSFIKLQKHGLPIHFTMKDWEALMVGYQEH